MSISECYKRHGHSRIPEEPNPRSKSKVHAHDGTSAHIGILIHPPIVDAAVPVSTAASPQRGERKHALVRANLPLLSATPAECNVNRRVAGVLPQAREVARQWLRARDALPERVRIRRRCSDERAAGVDDRLDLARHDRLPAKRDRPVTEHPEAVAFHDRVVLDVAGVQRLVRAADEELRASLVELERELAGGDGVL